VRVVVHFLVLVLGLTAFQLLTGCGGGGSSSNNGGGSGGNTNQTPAISSLSPATIPAGSSALTLTVSGSGFTSSSVVKVGGTAETTTFVSASQLTAAVPASQLTSGGNLSVVVVNGTTSSGSANFEVDNPAPVISSMSPTTEVVGSSSLVVTITGTGFVPTTTVNVNGAGRTTSYASATQVNVTLNASDVTATGTLSITAVNSAPGGGTSAAATLPVNNPAPGAIQLSPSALPVGATSPATVTVTGTGFIPSSFVNLNGNARATTYVSATSLTFVATVADQAAQGKLTVSVTNPGPGGGTSSVAQLTIQPGTVTPFISSVTPASFVAGSPDSSINVSGTGFTTNSVVRWNGADLQTYYLGYYGAPQLYASIPAADLAVTGTASVTVNTPTATPSLSNAVSVSITNPPAPTLTSMYPSGGPVNTSTTVNLIGTGFTAKTTVAMNGIAIDSSFVDSTQITATIPDSSVALPGNASITVTTPAPGGGTSAALLFTVYLQIANKDIVYNATDGLLYASVPVTNVGSGGNSVVGIDPVTGNIKRTIWVGSNPNKLALSTDGKQLFVGLDGAGAVAQVDLTQGKVVSQFQLGGGSGVYNPPYTAQYLAAVPGSPNSVAVTAQQASFGGYGITIYDSGVPRANTYTNGAGPLAFGSSASVLYTTNNNYSPNIAKLTVDSTGVSSYTNLSTVSGNITTLQYDNGRLYLSNGQVFDASAGTLLGTFYSSASTPANGPVVSDSSLGRAFIGVTSYTTTGQVLAFNGSTFNSAGSIPVGSIGIQGYPTNFTKIVRWGQNGLAITAAPSYTTSLNQIFIFQSPIVADLSASPADVGVTITAPSTGATGTAASWVAKVTNNGPNQAIGVALSFNLDSSLIINSITSTAGSCGSGSEFTCDLGTLANGSSVTVTVSATPTTAGKLAGAATVSTTTVDPTTTNNQATSSTTVSGSLYAATPLLQSISPSLVQAGRSDFTLTVTGAGFNENSIVKLGSTALATSFVSATQLTATVPAASVASYGWASITVSNGSPGGGVSQILPLTIYSIVSVPANNLTFDAYSRLLYATVPSTATSLTGNSVVSIDPVTGTIGTPVLVGSQPTVMAETSDGNYLYIGLQGASSIAKFNLLNKTLSATIPVNLTQYSTTSPVAPTWLATMPGNNSTLAVGMNNPWGQFGIFDISGNTGTFRTNVSGIYNGVDPVFADQTHVYAYDSQTSGAEFYRYSVDANGLTLIDGTTLIGMGGFAGSFQISNKLVYGGGGGIANPSTTPPAQIATLPLLDFYGSGVNGVSQGAVPDPSLQKEFLMLENIAGTAAAGLVRYDLTTYQPEALLSIPQGISGYPGNWAMFRFGQDGLAMLSSYQDYSVNSLVTTVMLIRGPFVAPQLLKTGSSAASLSSSSSSTLTHGSGNTTLTLTGTNFQPGVAVTWNGSYRTTTILDSTHVTVAVPASDIAATGSATIIATNPGAAASNSLHITIN
jgi:hypothetical protein